MKSRALAWYVIAGWGWLATINGVQAQPRPAGVASPTSVAAAPANAPGAAADRVARYGKVRDVRPVGEGGLLAWTVQAKNGQQVVLYTTPDASVIFTGILWDAKTGKNLSDAFLPKQHASVPSAAATAAAAREHKVAALDGKYTGAIPASIKTVASLKGVQEGKGRVSDTVYIIFDPRCPYCHAAYALTRKYVKKGFTIKWIPSLALGHPASGAPLAAAILQSKTPLKVLDQVMTSAYPVGGTVTPTKATMQALGMNLSFLFAAFKNSHTSGPAGVPVAFYIDHRTGKPTMMTGVSTQVVLDDIFGQI